MPICKLCQTDTTLRKSHIYPDHLYRLVKDNNYRYYAYTSLGARKIRQQGLVEKLFCQDCEQLLANEYENYFADFWLNNEALPNSISQDEIVISGIDYLKFKLYHLSILYRTAISSQPTFKHIELGPHQERIRLMLLNQNDSDKYHIVPAALIKNDRSVVKKVMTFPKWAYLDGHTFYNTIYGGCAWGIKTSNHEMPGLSMTGLRSDGTMVVNCERYEGYAELLQTSKCINQADN
ncbi:hypothetical protein [uncultured Pseudodesulfovibrio sp.]|uniref:hypothetical protein n=1 Tax=uncultured Pseudodesulfovibrio sp. TaxID=2035858 RepID=UPI0029C83788|nr:hypothetical protein [uncultured Pseudodesulfovibrio sp.]